MIVLPSLLLLGLAPGCGDTTSGRDSTVPLGDSGTPGHTGAPGDTQDTQDTDDSGVPTPGDGLLDVSGWDPYAPGVVQVTPVPLVPGETATVTYTGELSLETALIMHHGFNGWNEVSGLEDLTAEVSTGDEDWFVDAEMTNNGDYTHSVTVDVPTDGRALHMVFTSLASGTWDNNDLQDFGEGIVFPYAGPWLSWNEQVGPTEGMVVSFQTGVSCLGTVEYGPTEAFGHHAVGTESSTVHHIALSELAPDSEWFYRVYDSRGRVSDTLRFVTPPADSDALSLLIMGDMQDGGATQRWADVAAEAAANHSDAHAIFLVGDMAYNDKPGHWWTFFDKGRPLLGSVPLLPVPGNHDTPGTASTPQMESFVRYFSLPWSDGAGTDTDTHWSVRLGPVALLGFNSEDKDGFVPDTGDQYLWAADMLTEHADAGWVFAAWHNPPYNAGNRHYLEQHDTRAITEQFDGVVDWFFGGHEHMAQRFHPLRHSGVLASSGLYGPGEGDGVGYFIAPPAGNQPSTQLVPPDAEEAYYRDRLAWPVFAGDAWDAESELGFARVDVAGESFQLRVFGMGDLDEHKDAAVRDDLSYERGEP